MMQIFNDIITFLKSIQLLPTTIISFVVAVITLWIKSRIERKDLSSKLETEHKFNEQKKIKEVLAKYKVHLLNASEELNIRIRNFTKHNSVKSVYEPIEVNPHLGYIYRSIAYRILSLYAWIEKLNKEMVFLDTTISTKGDLEFVKILKLLSKIFSDEKLIIGPTATKKDELDRILMLHFETLPAFIVSDKDIISFSSFEEKLSANRNQIKVLLDFLDGISPTEDRMRWDRLQLFHLTVVIFLNNFGYDFQKESGERIMSIFESIRQPIYLKNFFEVFITEYRINDNKEIMRIRKLADKFIGKIE